MSFVAQAYIAVCLLFVGIFLTTMVWNPVLPLANLIILYNYAGIRQHRLAPLMDLDAEVRSIVIFTLTPKMMPLMLIPVQN